MADTTVDTAVIGQAVELACRAPSFHNSQPWRWVLDGGTLHLFLDPSRIVHSVDDSGREAVISCGAALDHLGVALAAVGFDTRADLMPNPNNPDHLASVDVVPLGYVGEVRRGRAGMIRHRRTDRRPFGAPADWETVEHVLHNSIDGERVALQTLDDDVRPLLAKAARLAESLRRYDDRYHQELDWWTSPCRDHDGVPERVLPSDEQAGEVGLNREFPVAGPSEAGGSGGSGGAFGAPAMPDRAKILVLSTPKDTRADALRCGQALSAILLDCALAGLATCTLTNITETDASRAIVRRLIGPADAMPQLLIRVGTAAAGKAPDHTPRRPLGEVLEVR